MASIADVFLRTLLDTKELMVDAQKAGDQAGQTMGSRMSKGLAVGLRAGLGVVAGAAGLATKGLLELEQITADFTAETGATAEEAKRAGQAINEMAGRNIQPMREIGATLTKVHTDLGLTGEEAERTAEAFLRFGRATKQEASAAVLAFDDILDAWGLTAADAQGIMDKLVTSHQEYGGSIEGNQSALASMAPQLRALNLEVDDGIAILNLFAASGLDAAGVPRALNSAIQKLDGQPLEAFVAELAGIEDPTERAQRAIEVFGSRAGAQLANAIQPGVSSLEDFKITTEEATGSTERAADALDNTFGAKVQLAIKGFTSKLIELGGAFGPVVTGLASLASLGGALGLDKVFQKIGASAAVKGAASKAGAAVAITFRTAFAGAMALGAIVATALNAIPGSSLVKGAASKLGNFLGTSLGKVGAAAFAAFMIFEVVQTYNRIKAELDAQLAQISTDAQKQLTSATNDALAMQKAALEKGIADLNSVWDLGLFTGDARAKLQAELDATNAELERRASEMGPSFGEGLAQGAPDVGAGADAMLGGMVGPLLEAVGDAYQGGRDAVAAHAQALRGGWDSVQGAWDSLKDAMKDPMSKAKRIAELEGILSSKRLAKGLKSNDPLIRAESEALVIAIEDELALLKGIGEDKGQKGGKGVADGLRDKKGAVRDAAGDLNTAASNKLGALNLRDEGREAGGQFAAGLRSALNIVGGAAAALAAEVAKYLQFGSPTERGPFSEDGGPEGWGTIGAQDFAKGWDQDPSSTVSRLAERARAALAAPLGNAVLPNFALAGAAMGGAAGPLPPTAAGLVVNGGIHLHGVGSDVSPQRARDFGQQVLDEVASGFRQQTARLPKGPRA